MLAGLFPALILGLSKGRQARPEALARPRLWAAPRSLSTGLLAAPAPARRARARHGPAQPDRNGCIRYRLPSGYSPQRIHK
jgi:hypothetical protein